MEQGHSPNQAPDVCLVPAGEDILYKKVDVKQELWNQLLQMDTVRVVTCAVRISFSQSLMYCSGQTLVSGMAQYS